MESLLPLIIQLASGAVGGNIVGRLFSSLSLGTLGNSIAGIVGGGIGGQLMNSVGMSAGGGMDLMGILGSVVASGVGGGVLMVVIGFIRRLIGR